jgi:hypothetical protein
MYGSTGLPAVLSKSAPDEKVEKGRQRREKETIGKAQMSGKRNKTTQLTSKTQPQDRFT